ncbi:MAG: PEP-CTERM sorting domain-containing protein [Thiobacillus sp.]|nr:PEP-CTERM sorting domain-containing protein [Thiobacillus sp.]
MRLHPAALLSSLLLVGSLAHAAPIVFTSTSYTTFALADAGNASDGPFSQAGDASLLPLSSSASALGDDGDTASAVAFADTLFLTATSEANAVASTAASTAIATFTGSFNALPGLLNLSLAFDALIDSLGGGLAGNQLAVTLEVGGITLFSDLLSSSALIDQSFLLASGGAGLFDLTLIGTAEAAAPGDYAFSLASVNASLDAVAVPEPGSVALLLAGMFGLGLMRRRLGRAGVQAASVVPTGI